MKNRTGFKWKATAASILVMAMLVSTSLIVNAGIVELVLGEEYLEVMAQGSSSEETHECKPKDVTYEWACPHGGYKKVNAAYCTDPDCGRLLGASGEIKRCPDNICETPLIGDM